MADKALEKLSKEWNEWLKLTPHERWLKLMREVEEKKAAIEQRPLQLTLNL